jgi:hypothetical protein
MADEFFPTENGFLWLNIIKWGILLFTALPKLFTVTEVLKNDKLATQKSKFNLGVVSTDINFMN